MTTLLMSSQHTEDNQTLWRAAILWHRQMILAFLLILACVHTTIDGNYSPSPSSMPAAKFPHRW